MFSFGYDGNLWNKTLTSKITSLPDISKWSTGNVTSMKYMFRGCSSLISFPDFQNGILVM